MTLSLSKGGNLSLTKAAPGLKHVRVGLGWDARTTDGSAFDLDASALLLAADGKVRGNEDFVYYGQKADAVNSVRHGGDNLTGQGDGDDETIEIDLETVPADVTRIPITVSIYEEATPKTQNFGQVSNAFVRIVDAETGEEVVRYDLSEDYSAETALIFAEVYRNGAEWKFKAVGQGWEDGLEGIARSFGVGI